MEWASLDPVDFPTLEAWLAKRFTVKDGQPTWICECGEEYVEFAFGTRPQDIDGVFRKWPVPENAKGLAERALAQAIRVYAEDKQGTVYWRIRPYLREIGGGHWGARARLVISDRQLDGC